MRPVPDRAAIGKIIAVHLNYRSRAEQRDKLPSFPSYFLKPSSSVVGSGEPIVRPGGCELLAFEGEIALIIGTRARDVLPEAAWQYVGAITAANDVGVYDLRYADAGSNLRSKGSDSFTPVGPTALDARSVDPATLRLTVRVNGSVLQDARVADEILFDFGVIVADLSRLMTLEPGDVILTGTPAGSTVVVPGDVVEVEVTTDDGRSTGVLRNPVIAGAALAPIGAMPRVDDDVRAAAHGDTPVRGDSSHVGTDVLAQLATVSTATLASQLRKRGLEGCTFDGVHPVRAGARFVGRAKTLQYLPLREDLSGRIGGGYNAQKRAVDEIDAGDVLVISARGRVDAGTIGDLLALRAQLRGAAGVVTDGAVRDHDTIARLDLPVFSAGKHPAVLGRRHVPWAVDVPVACAGVLVMPGDLLVGDGDGVVLVPDAHAADIAADAIEQERQERFVHSSISAGYPVEGLYPIGPSWRPRYEKWLEAGEPS